MWGRRQKLSEPPQAPLHLSLSVTEVGPYLSHPIIACHHVEPCLQIGHLEFGWQLYAVGARVHFPAATGHVSVRVYVCVCSFQVISVLLNWACNGWLACVPQMQLASVIRF